VKQRWFRPWGWFYRPTSWQGNLVVAVTSGVAAHLFVVVDRNSHSASDTFYGFFPYLVSCWVLAYWVASRTSRPEP
jgi:hypothetical protein